MKGNSNKIFAAIFAVMAVVVTALVLAAGGNTGGSGGGAGSTSSTGGDPMTVVSEKDGVTTYADGDTVYQPKAKEIKYDKSENVRYYQGLIDVFLADDYNDTIRDELAQSVGGTVIGSTHGVVPMLQIKVGKAKYAKLAKLAKQLEKRDEVDRAKVSLPQYVENDVYDNTWGDGDTYTEGNPSGTNWWAEAINAYSAWEYADENIAETNYPAVGVLEASGSTVKTSKVAKTLGGSFTNLAEDKQGSENQHGTSVSQLIAANTDQDKIRGVASSSDIYYGNLEGTTIKEGSTVTTTTEGVRMQEAFVVDYGCRFINCSYGSIVYSPLYYQEKSDEESYDDYMASVRAELKNSAENMFILIGKLCASGNDNFVFIQSSGNGLQDANNHSTSVPRLASDNGSFCSCTEECFDELYPSGTCKANAQTRYTYDELRSHILVVGSVEMNGNEYVMSNWCGYGDNVDLLAPGSGIYLPAYGDEESGTSFSAPMVTGAMALVWASEPSLTAVEVRERLIENATEHPEDRNADISVTDNNDKLKHPVLDVEAALDVDETDASGGGSASNPSDSSKSTKSAKSTSSDIAMSMVFDVSGSMESYSAVSGLTKIESAKKQASDFISSIEDDGDSDDVSVRAGVVSFADDSTENCALTSDANEIVSSINAMSTWGGTNIYSGMEQGINQLNSDDDAVKMMVLLSDGANNTGHSNDEVRELAEQAAQDDITIYTIGYGESYELDENLLRDIAETTGGEYSHEDATNLNQAAVGLYRVLKVAQLNAAGETLLLDEEGSVQQGETVEVGEATVDENGTLTAHLYWPGSTLQAVLTDPSGNTIDTSSDNVVVNTTDTTMQIKVKNVQTGTWTMSVIGKDVSMDDEPFFAAISHVATQAASAGGSAGGGGDNAGILLFLFVLVAAVSIFGVFAYSHRRAQ